MTADSWLIVGWSLWERAEQCRHSNINTLLPRAAQEWGGRLLGGGEEGHSASHLQDWRPGTAGSHQKDWRTEMDKLGLVDDIIS